MAASATPRKSAPRKAAVTSKPKVVAVHNGNGASASEEEQSELFRYTTPQGHVIEVIDMGEVPNGVLEDAFAMPGVQQNFALMKALLSKKDYEAFRAMTVRQSNDFMTEWYKFSGVTVGES